MSFIASLEIQDSIRIKAIALRPEGKTVTIGGRNGQGKTSLLWSIADALGGADAAPEKPVRKGAKKSKAVIKTTDGLTIKLTNTEAGGRTVVVESSDGFKATSPQAILTKLTAGRMFDPLHFANLEDHKQAELLRKITGLNFAAQDAEYKKLYDQRTVANREVNQAEFALNAAVHFPDAPSEPVKTEELVAELERANQHNERKADLVDILEESNRTLERRLGTVKTIENSIADLEAQLAKERAALETAKASVIEGEREAKSSYKAVQDFQAIDTAPITAKLAGASETNRQVAANAARAALQLQLEEKRKSSADLTAKLEQIQADKAKALAEAPFPVAGLSFDGDTVTFNGVPLDQCNFDERLRISFGICSALNPTLRAVIIRDASLLDDTNYANLLKLLDEYKLQGFIERVGTGKECQVIIEDGEVAELRDPSLAPPESESPDEPASESKSPEQSSFI
jgi:hypothetical protein